MSVVGNTCECRNLCHITNQQHKSGSGGFRCGVVIFCLDKVLDAGGSCAYIAVISICNLYQITDSFFPVDEIDEIFVASEHGMGYNQIFDGSIVDFVSEAGLVHGVNNTAVLSVEHTVAMFGLHLHGLGNVGVDKSDFHI